MKPTMKPTIYQTIKINNYTPEVKIHQGRKHLVVPVVMMVEGVHHGSNGQIFHSADELSRHIGAWNGIPIVINHPTEDGQAISANSPDVIDRETVGRVYNTRFESGKLKAEAWLDETQMGHVSPEAFVYIREKKPLDVSVGVFTDDEAIEGTWNNEAYTAISRNHRPDHLALLPGGVGACSWSDGCGVRVNSKGGDDLTQKEEHLRVLLSSYEFGMKEKIETLQRKLDQMDTDSKMHFLEEVFKGYCVYRVNMNVGEGIPFEQEYYKRTYSVNADGLVEFSGEPIPVRKKIEYKLINANSEGGNETMANEKVVKPCCPEKVDLLIQHKLTPFMEEDRAHLLAKDEKTIDILLTMQADYDTGIEKAKEAAGKVKEVPVQMNKEQLAAYMKDTFSSPEQFMAIMPDEYKGQMEHGMQLYQQHRDRLVARVKEAAPDVYTDAELTGMDMSSLEKLTRLIPARADYSLNGNPPAPVVNNEVKPLLPPGVKEAE